MQCKGLAFHFQRSAFENKKHNSRVACASHAHNGHPVDPQEHSCKRVRGWRTGQRGDEIEKTESERVDFHNLSGTIWLETSTGSPYVHAYASPPRRKAWIAHALRGTSHSDGRSCRTHGTRRQARASCLHNLFSKFRSPRRSSRRERLISSFSTLPTPPTIPLSPFPPLVRRQPHISRRFSVLFAFFSFDTVDGEIRN